jgi:hypothetical protein
MLAIRVNFIDPLTENLPPPQQSLPATTKIEKNTLAMRQLVSLTAEKRDG